MSGTAATISREGLAAETRRRVRDAWARRAYLGADHFAFYRGYLEGLPLETIADQYLETGLDLRMARSTLRWIREQLIAGARRAQDFTAARVIAIEPKRLAPPSDGASGDAPGTAPRIPSLEVFAEAIGPDGYYSQPERLALFAEQYPPHQADGQSDKRALHRAQRNERLRRRQMRALRVLQTLLAQAPAQHHHCAGWFHPVLARRLEKAGVVLLSDLFDLICLRGSRWYVAVRGLGAGGAKRLHQWLVDHAQALERTLPAIAQTPRRQVSDAMKQAARVQVDGIAPIEAMVWPFFDDSPRDAPIVDINHPGPTTPDAVSALPSVVTAARAWNRAVPERHALMANDDLDAVRRWLSSIQAVGGKTYSMYRHHAECLMNWLAFVRRLPLSAMSVDDCLAYRAFLLAPPAGWCAPRGTPRFSAAWRPLCGALKPQSVALAWTVVRSMTEWLVKVRYLSVNPFALAGTPKTGSESDAAFGVMQTRRNLPEDVWQLLDGFWQGRAVADAGAERTQFALQLGYMAGLRISELAAARLKQLRLTVLAGKAMWSLRVPGKGGKVRDVELAPVLARRVEAHLIGRGVGSAGGTTLAAMVADPGLGEVALIARVPGRRAAALPSASGSGVHAGLQPAALRRVIDLGYAVAAEALAHEHPAAAAVLRQATPHWLRHRFGTHALLRGANLAVVKDLMGHASIATTSQYLHPDKGRRHEDMAKVCGP